MPREEGAELALVEASEAEREMVDVACVGIGGAAAGAAEGGVDRYEVCLLYTSPSPRD